MNKSDFIIVYEGKYAGLKNKSGDIVLSCKYDKILDYDDDGYIRFIKDEIYGTIDLEGNVCIPLAKKLSHLGVFHKGTARARINETWGLVDVHGVHVTDFIYKSIDAHRKYGYKAVTLKGKQGILGEDGSFKVSSKQSKPKPLYSYIATYHNHVAPAVAQNGKWVFIDENQKRINDIEYWSMDHVLRQGVYYVAKGPNAYGIANFEGIPLIDEWYDHPCKFDKGYAVCDIKRHDENGKEIILPNGQPAYYYGVLNLEGIYVFQPTYSSLHWNNYKTKDCWFAEDENWAYLLFPDGTHRTYAKSKISYSGILPCIPESAYDHDIKADDSIVNYRPELVTTQYYSLFEESYYLQKLSSWLGGLIHPLEFYYRDTDADIDVMKLYKPGHFIRTDCCMEVTKKLLRPVHKIRFLIAARRFFEVDNSSREKNLVNLYDFKENMIPANTNFLIVDVQQCGGITQIVLLHFPHGAMLLAKHFKIKPSKFKPQDIDGIDLKNAAKYDLQQKMCNCVHGHSLDAAWCNTMYRPVGCNAQLQLNKLVMDHYSYSDLYRNNEINALRLLQDRDEEWKEKDFTKIQSNTIKVFTGDITKRIADVMINPVKIGSDNSIHFLKWFEESAEPELLDKCKTELETIPGSILVTDGYNFPYQKIVHIRLSKGDTSSVKELKTLRESLDNALKQVEVLGYKSILIPGMTFKNKDEIKTVIKTLTDHLFAQSYSGEIEIFTHTSIESEAYKAYFESIGNKDIIKPYVLK